MFTDTGFCTGKAWERIDELVLQNFLIFPPTLEPKESLIPLKQSAF